jgi:hypothetical protein
VFGDLDNGDQVDVAGAGVDLGHPVEVGDGLRCLGDAVGGGVHLDDRGDHDGSLGFGLNLTLAVAGATVA